MLLRTRETTWKRSTTEIPSFPEDGYVELRTSAAGGAAPMRPDGTGYDARVGTPREAAVVGGAPPRAAADVAWAATALLVPLILGLVSLMGAIDLAYHLRTGDLILAERSLPRVDTYTFSVAGTPWVDQQWGAQVILALVFRMGGWPTLIALQAVLGTVSFAFVYLAARARGASARMAAALTLAGFLLAYPMITLRPQLIALPTFGAALWAISTRERAPRRLWLLPMLAVVAANLHGSFTLLPVLAGLTWFDDVSRRSAGAKRTLIVVFATGAATLLNPYGFGAWRYAFDLSTDPIIRDSITEWAPITIGSALGAATLVSVLGIAALFARRMTPVRWVDLLTLGLFLLLALSASRAVLWWAMVAPIVVAGLLAPSPSEPREGESAGSRGPAIVLIAGLLTAIAVLLPWWRGSSYDRHLEAAPPGVTEALRALPAGSRIFAYQPWGSWFVYALPEQPVFVDSRIEIVPTSTWEDYFQVAFAGARWREVLERWQPDAIVAEVDEWEEMIAVIRGDPEWRVLYEDDDGVIFVPI